MPGAYQNRGAAKAGLGLYREAIADYSEAIRINPGYATAYNNRGAVRFALGLYEGAIGDFGKVIEINRENAEAYNNRGLARKSLGQFSAAIEDFERARLLAKEQGNANLQEMLNQELNDLKSKDPNTPAFFQVDPHRSGYVEGIDPGNLKELLYDMDDDRFVEKSEQ